MYILKNAFISIFRNKGRNILMAIIITVIACASAITLAIMNSANNLVTAYKNKYNIEATISFNREKLMGTFTPGEDNNETNINTFNELQSLSVDNINTYGNSEYVKYFYYTYEIGIDGNSINPATDSLEKVTTESKTTTKGPMGPDGRPGRETTATTKVEEIKNMRGQNGEFNLIGYSSYEGMSNFINGTYTIKEGSVSEDFDSYNCVINEELATLNEIAVGDTITLKSVNDEDLTYKLTVTGIYTDNDNESSNMNQMYSNSVNTIITNVTVINAISSADEDLNVTTTPTFILNNEDDITKFSTEVSEKGLSEYLQVTTNIDTIQSETKSIQNVSTFALTFLIITLIIGIVVLLFINMINVRERKYEIGVLRTIGMKKSLVTCQFIFELLVVAFIGLILGAVIGATSSVKVANKLLENEINSATESSEKINNNFGSRNNNFTFNMNGVAKVKQVDNINAVVNVKVLLELMSIGIILTIISGSSAMISIAKFSPLTILKERS